MPPISDLVGDFELTNPPCCGGGFNTVMFTEQVCTSAFTELTESWGVHRHMHYPKDIQSFPAKTQPRGVKSIPSQNLEALVWPLLMTSSGQASPLRKPALARARAVRCRQMGSGRVLICRSGLEGG